MAAAPRRLGPRSSASETDSGDAEYEAHLATADGSEVTVLLDGSFKGTDTAEGFGGRKHHDGYRDLQNGDRDRHHEGDDRP